MIDIVRSASIHVGCNQCDDVPLRPGEMYTVDATPVGVGYDVTDCRRLIRIPDPNSVLPALGIVAREFHGRVVYSSVGHGVSGIESRYVSAAAARLANLLGCISPTTIIGAARRGHPIGTASRM